MTNHFRENYGLFFSTILILTHNVNEYNDFALFVMNKIITVILITACAAIIFIAS